MACWHGVNSFGTAWIAQQLSIKYLTPTGTTGAHRQEGVRCGPLSPQVTLKNL
jgi:hypothetical protein